MDRRLMFIRKTITPGGCLPLPWGYTHVYDHNIQTSSRPIKLYAIQFHIYVYEKMTPGGDGKVNLGRNAFEWEK